MNYRVKRKALPQYASYRCPPRSIHILCHACRQQMPLRCRISNLPHPRRAGNVIRLDIDSDEDSDFDSDDDSITDDSDTDNGNDVDDNENNANNDDNVNINDNNGNNDNNDNNENNDNNDNDNNNNNNDNDNNDPTNTNNVNPDEPDIPQQCFVCKNYFCDKYMEDGCQNINGRLDKLEDITIVDVPPTAFKQNNFEKQILINYLDSKNISVNDCWKVCVANLFDHKYQLGNVFLQNIQRDSYICYKCSRQIFSELIYQYRLKEVDKNDLPENIRDRPDCWYGKNCRTQFNKQDHARKYNHICEQTHY